jgi:hypothetical protein
MEHRRDRVQGQGPLGMVLALSPLPMLDELCFALAEQLVAEDNAPHP